MRRTNPAGRLLAARRRVVPGGGTGGKVTRNCTVPEGVKLFVPAVNTFCVTDDRRS